MNTHMPSLPSIDEDDTKMPYLVLNTGDMDYDATDPDETDALGLPIGAAMTRRRVRISLTLVILGLLVTHLVSLFYTRTAPTMHWWAEGQSPPWSGASYRWLIAAAACAMLLSLLGQLERFQASWIARLRPLATWVGLLVLIGSQLGQTDLFSLSLGYSALWMELFLRLALLLVAVTSLLYLLGRRSPQVLWTLRVALGGLVILLVAPRPAEPDVLRPSVDFFDSVPGAGKLGLDKEEVTIPLARMLNGMAVRNDASAAVHARLGCLNQGTCGFASELGHLQPAHEGPSLVDRIEMTTLDTLSLRYLWLNARVVALCVLLLLAPVLLLPGLTRRAPRLVTAVCLVAGSAALFAATGLVSEWTYVLIWRIAVAFPLLPLATLLMVLVLRATPPLSWTHGTEVR